LVYVMCLYYKALSKITYKHTDHLSTFMTVHCNTPASVDSFGLRTGPKYEAGIVGIT